MSYRKLKLGKDTWKYVIGSGVKIQSPEGKSLWVEGWKILGFESKEKYIETIYDSYDQDQCLTEPITPKTVREYIEKNLL